jgi:CPA1 family monovalent cation:H+ antiporter
MYDIVLMFFLVLVVVVLTLTAEKAKIPYPILLTLGGLAISLLPGMPVVTINPDYVFLFFLPPLLYGAAWATSWRDFYRDRRAILLLSIGCVIFTTVGVAAVAHWLIPSLSWAVCFTLGAIVSPPDAVAATSVLQNVGAPRRIKTILEGESLVNDATGLVAYRFAVAAVLTGMFNIYEAAGQFVLVAVGGIAVGLAFGMLLVWIHQNVLLDSPIVETTVTFLSPYAMYIAAEQLHLSGVLAVVTGGLWITWRQHKMFSAATRLLAVDAWNWMIFVFNGLVFILIGLQMAHVRNALNEYDLLDLIWWGLVVSVATIAIRFIWMYPGTYLPRFLFKSIRKKDPYPHWRNPTIAAWAGMRGVVSLAAALALPLTMRNGEPFPNRTLILFLTFCVIISTLVLQGLTLPWLMQKLGMRKDNVEEQEELLARRKAAEAVLAHLKTEAGKHPVPEHLLSQVQNRYRLRLRHYAPDNEGCMDENQEEEFYVLHQLEKDLLEIERRELARLRNERLINDEVMKRVERGIDLEEERLNTLMDKNMMEHAAQPVAQ